jgi:uncharacterized protein YjbI with pentapeptide repeats
MSVIKLNSAAQQSRQRSEVNPSEKTKAQKELSFQKGKELAAQGSEKNSFLTNLARDLTQSPRPDAKRPNGPHSEKKPSFFSTIQQSVITTAQENRKNWEKGGLEGKLRVVAGVGKDVGIAGSVLGAVGVGIGAKNLIKNHSDRQVTSRILAHAMDSGRIPNRAADWAPPAPFKASPIYTPPTAPTGHVLLPKGGEFKPNAMVFNSTERRHIWANELKKEGFLPDLEIGPSALPKNYEGAYFANKNLHAAQLEGANLRNANFNDARLGSISGLQGDLAGTNPTRTTFAAADLRGATFNKTDFRSPPGSIGNLYGPNFADANIENVDFSTSILPKANFAYAKMSGAKLPKGIQISSISDAQVHGAQLRGAQFLGPIGADLRRLQAQTRPGQPATDLRRARIEYANATDANLSGAKLEEATVANSVLGRVNLANANLNNARLRRVDVRGTDFSGVDHKGINFAANNLVDWIAFKSMPPLLKLKWLGSQFT